MKEIELLEKLVEMQEMHIELMNDFNNLKNCYKDLEEIKNRRIDDLNNIIKLNNTNKGQSEEIGAQAERIEALEVENAELKKQIEILQQALVTVESPDENK